MDRLPTLRLWRAGAAIATALLAAPQPRAAQSAMATVSIEVRDQTGAVLPEVLVTMTNQATGIPQRDTSSAQGTLVFARVRTGLYTLVATRDGFKTEVVRDIWVQPAIHGKIALALTPGALTEQVMVTADPSTV